MMNRTTILVIEDDLDLAEALTETLELAGFDACSVNSGEAALARLEQIEPGLLLCDVNMPGMDGHQLLQQVKGSRPMLPVVLMTAYGSIEKAVQAMRQDAADYLVKPFSSERLIERCGAIYQRPRSTSMIRWPRPPAVDACWRWRSGWHRAIRMC